MATQITNSVVSNTDQKSAEFTATGDVVVVCNLGAVQVECSPDSGTTWYVIAVPSDPKASSMIVTAKQTVTFTAVSGFSYRLSPANSMTATASAYQ